MTATTTRASLITEVKASVPGFDFRSVQGKGAGMSDDELRAWLVKLGHDQADIDRVVPVDG